MRMPALDDTIIAAASGWSPSPVGILRLSGPRAYELIGRVDAGFPPAGDRPKSGWRTARLAIADDVEFPGMVCWFTAPGSYTGQDLVEIHTIGSLPALRELSERLISMGARGAGPGEFTARAFLNGKLDADQVDEVLLQLSAGDAAAARRAARASRGSAARVFSEIAARIAALLARVEAGIDFVEEEDVSFIAAEELRGEAEDILESLSEVEAGSADSNRAALPRVALAGASNAGKSTLFNALLGYERAIVASAPGTTRDVLSETITMEGVALTLQDRAGLSAARDEAEAAAHRVSEQAEGEADLVLWVHDVAAPWSAAEIRACGEIEPERLLLVLNKSDERRYGGAIPSSLDGRERVKISALHGTGLSELRVVLGVRLKECWRFGESYFVEGVKRAQDSLARIAAMALPDKKALLMPEVVALELRQAYETMERLEKTHLSEEVLENIFSRFCVGK